MADAFARIAARTPTHMGTLEVLFHVTPGDPVGYDAKFSFDALDADGIVKPISGDLTPPATSWTLTAAHKAALAACTNVAQVQKLLLDLYLAKAEGAIG